MCNWSQAHHGLSLRNSGKQKGPLLQLRPLDVSFSRVELAVEQEEVVFYFEEVLIYMADTLGSPSKWLVMRRDDWGGRPAAACGAGDERGMHWIINEFSAQEMWQLALIPSLAGKGLDKTVLTNQ